LPTVRGQLEDPVTFRRGVMGGLLGEALITFWVEDGGKLGGGGVGPGGKA